MLLDDVFGAAFPPGRIGWHEALSFPESRQKLNDKTAILLLNYMRTAIAGLSLPAFNHNTLIILWLMDEDGDIWFAMEEALNLETGRSEFPAPRAVPLASTHRKLGHPSLLENSAKHARIGGEIVYDPLFGEKGWVLSNSSGRYGTSPDRRKEHLDNVAARFGNYGLVFDVYYI